MKKNAPSSPNFMSFPNSLERNFKTKKRLPAKSILTLTLTLAIFIGATSLIQNSKATYSRTC